MSTSSSGPARKPQAVLTVPIQHVQKFESLLFRACDAFARARDAWSFDDIAATNFDYVDKQLLRCLDAVSHARVEILDLIRTVEETVMLAEDHEAFQPYPSDELLAGEQGPSKGGRP